MPREIGFLITFFDMISSISFIAFSADFLDFEVSKSNFSFGEIGSKLRLLSWLFKSFSALSSKTALITIFNSSSMISPPYYFVLILFLLSPFLRASLCLPDFFSLFLVLLMKGLGSQKSFDEG